MSHLPARAAAQFAFLGLVLVPGIASAQSAPSNFTYATRFDPAGRPTGTITPDPDGTDGNPFIATRISYDAAGRPIRVENGTLSDWQPDTVVPAGWAGFTVSTQVDTTYDGLDRKVTEILCRAV